MGREVGREFVLSEYGEVVDKEGDEGADEDVLQDGDGEVASSVDVYYY